MKFNKTQEDLVELTAKYIKEFIVHDDKKVNEIKSQLSKNHNITSGHVAYYFNDPRRLSEANLNELALIAEQVYLKSEDEQLEKQAAGLNLTEWFHDNEILEFRNYTKVDERDVDEITLPYTFNQVLQLRDNAFIVTVDYSEIARMYKYDVLYYNINVQREGQKIKIGNEIIQVPRIHWSNVKEITDFILKGELEDTQLVYNCLKYSSTHSSEQELIYDKKNGTLTVTEGTRIDILDGAHRTIGITEAYNQNPNIEGKVSILIKNYTEEEAKRYQWQLSKAVPFDKNRAEALVQAKKSDEVVNILKVKGELKGKIKDSNQLQSQFGELVSHAILSNAVDKFYNPKNGLEVRQHVDVINEYMLYLFGYFGELNDGKNLLFRNAFFHGHILLSKRMFDAGIDFSKLDVILAEYDFSIDNKIWEEKYIVKDGRIDLKKSIRYIEKFVKEIDLDKLKVNN